MCRLTITSPQCFGLTVRFNKTVADEQPQPPNKPHFTLRFISFNGAARKREEWSREIFIWLPSISLTDFPKTVVRTQNPNYKHDAWSDWKVASRSHGYACFTIAIYSIMGPARKKLISLLNFWAIGFGSAECWQTAKGPAMMAVSASTIFSSIKIKKFLFVEVEWERYETDGLGGDRYKSQVNPRI